MLESDAGTENNIMADMQMMFREDDDDHLAGARSHRYVKSTSNQVDLQPYK